MGNTVLQYDNMPIQFKYPCVLTEFQTSASLYFFIPQNQVLLDCLASFR